MMPFTSILPDCQVTLLAPAAESAECKGNCQSSVVGSWPRGGARGVGTGRRLGLLPPPGGGV